MERHKVNVMSNLIRWRDDNHLMPLLLAASVVVLIAIAAAVVWSRGSLTGDKDNVVSMNMMRGAFDRVAPGRTSSGELAQLGFDTARYRSRTLSGLGVQEYFMPASSEEFDRLDPAVRACFETPDRCRALVFPVGEAPSEGLMAAHAATREAGMVFLLRNGRVEYKAVQAG
jgi:hypothetical protein